MLLLPLEGFTPGQLSVLIDKKPFHCSVGGGTLMAKQRRGSSLARNVPMDKWRAQGFLLGSPTAVQIRSISSEGT